MWDALFSLIWPKGSIERSRILFSLLLAGAGFGVGYVACSYQWFTNYVVTNKIISALILIGILLLIFILVIQLATTTLQNSENGTPPQESNNDSSGGGDSE